MGRGGDRSKQRSATPPAQRFCFARGRPRWYWNPVYAAATTQRLVASLTEQRQAWGQVAAEAQPALPACPHLIRNLDAFVTGDEGGGGGNARPPGSGAWVDFLSREKIQFMLGTPLSRSSLSPQRVSLVHEEAGRRSGVMAPPSGLLAGSLVGKAVGMGWLEPTS